jgi:hypothetical protein
MISLANTKRIVALVRIHRSWTYWLTGCCAVLFGGSAIFAQQIQFQGSVSTGAASPTPLSLTNRAR